ncbi:hypothetical protein GWI33_009265 [Rhynchophorus ferrugineus]|uniref:Uncharacterized protein n=1 Tax=Rhynchophorus ferrugineus TaxID=354439 RepID=A0A834IH00_RHYFE|nr:hypothetical protein GWI33_009265 [Rhynchophorus ferrugineus]
MGKNYSIYSRDNLLNISSKKMRFRYNSIRNPCRSAERRRQRESMKQRKKTTTATNPKRKMINLEGNVEVEIQKLGLSERARHWGTDKGAGR